MDLKRFWVLFFMMASVMVAAISDQELFLQANELYKQQEYQKALDGYLGIQEQTSDVLYNIGNCYFKLKRYGKALLLWRKAEMRWSFFNRAELVGNINLAQKKLYQMHNSGKNMPQNKKSYAAIKHHVLIYMRTIPLFFFQLLFLVMLALSTLFAYAGARVRKKNKKIVVLLCVAVLSTGSLLAVKYGLMSRDYGIATAERVVIRSGPDEGYKQIGILNEGQEAFITRESGSYFKIKNNSQQGWVDSAAFEKI